MTDTPAAGLGDPARSSRLCEKAIDSAIPKILSGSPASNRMKGMSLISLLVVMVIIGILAVLLLAGAKSAMEALKGSKCANNLRQLAVATQLYTAENNGYLPFYQTSVVSTNGSSFNAEGAWYWHLAPYLDIPRWTTNKTYLGPERGKISGPNVFCCPAHGKKEVSAPLEFPSNKPVSYAPNGEISFAMKPLARQGAPDLIAKGLRVQEITAPDKKAWLSDSTHSTSLNVSASRWTSDDDSLAWARLPFNRHNGAGNVLFYDGHVERITCHSIVSGDLRANVLRLFRPNY